MWLNLKHENILPLYGTIRDTKMHPYMPAMVCPWIENGALTEYLEKYRDLAITKRLALACVHSDSCTETAKYCFAGK